MKLASLKPKVSELLKNSNSSLSDRLTSVCELLQTSVDAYDWVGFYFANHEEKKLYLKAFSGEPTDHTVIPFGKGICGQVAVSNSNFVVPNVQEQNNYISCSLHVKSEIVIPLFKSGLNMGQIDIDSHILDAFNEEDERFLEWVNQEVSNYLDLNAIQQIDFL